MGSKMDVSKNSGTPKSSILIGVSIINHPFWGTPISGNTQMFPNNYSMYLDPPDVPRCAIKQPFRVQTTRVYLPTNKLGSLVE